MNWDVDTRVWQNTPKGDVTVVRPKPGLEIVSVRAWRAGFSGCGPMLTLVTLDTPGTLGVHVSGRRHTLGVEHVLLVTEGELFEIAQADGSAFSVLYLDGASLDCFAERVGSPAEALFGAYLLSSAALNRALRATLASAATGDPAGLETAFAQTERELLDCLRRAALPGTASA